MKHHPTQLPLARKDELIVKEVDDELLVYDKQTDEAHCLNNTAAQVWRNCDGEKSIADIQVSVENEVGKQVDEELVWLALDQLERSKLLDRVPPTAPILSGMNRRQLMRTIGLTAAAIPLVTSIVAPSAVSATSVCGAPCDPVTNQCTNPACNTCSGNPKTCK